MAPGDGLSHRIPKEERDGGAPMGKFNLGWADLFAQIGTQTRGHLTPGMRSLLHRSTDTYRYGEATGF